MASLQKKGNGWYCQFLHHGKRHTFAVGAVAEGEARAKGAQVDYLLLRLEQRLIELPAGVDIVEFLRHDGKPPAGAVAIPERQALTLAAFRDRYLATHRESLEPRTIEGIELHFRHLVASLGERLPIRELGLSDLQGYVDGRSTAKGTVGKRLSPATIKKEIVTLRTAWNWGVKMGLVVGRFPYDGLRYPKMHEKPPFQTREQIERQIAGGGLTEQQQAELWHSLYLQQGEIEEALAIIRDASPHAWVHAMAATAAYTGARRSELIRMRVADVDFDAKAVTVREKKRIRGKQSTRRVPLTGVLAGILAEYLKTHPGGHHLFCHAAEVARSKKRSRTTGHRGGDRRATTLGGRLASVGERERAGLSPLTEDEAHDHLKRSLARSRWAVIRGWHSWRHAFVSACASKGVDQRLLQGWCGHMTAEVSARYAHLYPSTQQSALDSVFG